MRDYARIAPTFWTRGSGKRLRGDPDAQVVAFYLFTCPAATMIGLYHLALPTMAHETGLPPDRARAALARVCAVQIAMYDEEDELVFLPEGAKYQIGPALSGNDPRKKGVQNALEPFCGHPFALVFLQKYARPYSLTIPEKYEAASKHLAGTLQAASKPLRSQDQDQDQDQANKRDPGFKTPPPSGAGPSPVLVPDPEPPASGAWAPVGPTEEAPAARPGGALETPVAIPDAPTHVGAPARPATSQPEPPTSPVPADPSPDAAATPAPLPEPDAPTAPVLPLSLAPAPSKHDPVVAIFEEYVAAWRKTTRGRRPPKLDDKRRRLTLARLRHFAEDDLKAAARGVFASRWHVEEGQTSYELVMRDAEHVERFMREDEATRPPPEPPSQGAPEWLTTAARPSPRVLETLRKMGPAAHGNLVGVLDDDIGTMEIT